MDLHVGCQWKIIPIILYFHLPQSENRDIWGDRVSCQPELSVDLRIILLPAGFFDVMLPGLFNKKFT